MPCRFCGAETPKTCCIDCARGQLGVPHPPPFYYHQEDSGCWLRFIAWAIDTIIIFSTILLIAQIGFYIFGINFFVVLGTFIHEILSGVFGRTTFIFLWIFSLFGLSILAWFVLFIIGYFVLGYPYMLLFETSKFKATPGKLLLGLEVVDKRGQGISKMMCTIRHIGKSLVLPTLGISFIIASDTSRRQTLHDIVSKCYVTKGDNYSDLRAMIISAITVILLVSYFVSTTTVSDKITYHPGCKPKHRYTIDVGKD